MSLRLQLAALTSGLAVLLLGGLGLYLHGAWEEWARTILVETLSSRADALAGTIEIEDDGELELEDEGAAFARDPAHPFRIEDEAGRVLWASPFEWPPMPPAASRERLDDVVDAQGHRQVVLSRPIELGKHRRVPVVLRVVASWEPFLALERRFLAGLWVALGVALVVGAAIAAALAHFFVAPIERLSRAVSAIGARSLHERVPEDRLAPELRSLASSFNGLLSRLESAFRREREFVARASHALRTPAATLLSQAEVALRRERSGDEYRRALGNIVAEARLAARLTDELLALSRLDEGAGSAPVDRVDLDPVLRELRTLFTAPAEQRGLTLALEVPPGLAVRADPAALREALANLLDNALRYTPAPGQVGLQARLAGDRVELVVWDTGPGIADDEKPVVTERFRRGKAGATASGSGLGLALVRAIADAHGARLRLEDRPGGGLQAVLAWPAALI